MQESKHTEIKPDDMISLHEYRESMFLKGLTGRYISRKRRMAERFLIYLEGKGKKAAQASSHDVDEYLKCRHEPLVPAEFNMRICCIRGFYGFLKSRGRVLINPAEDTRRLPRERNPNSHIFTEDEMRRILSAIPETLFGKRDRAIIELFYSTGMRSCELAGLDVQDVDFIQKEIIIRHGKGSKERSVPVGDAALDALLMYVEVRQAFIKPGRESDAMFLGREGWRLNRDAVRNRFYKWKGKAGVRSEGGIHTIRHSFASHLMKRGAPLPVIMRMLGHERLSVTQDYAKVPDDDLRAVYHTSHPGA